MSTAAPTPTPSTTPAGRQQTPPPPRASPPSAVSSERKHSYLYHLNPAGGFALPLRLPSATAASGDSVYGDASSGRGGGAKRPLLDARLEAGTTTCQELGRWG